MTPRLVIGMAAYNEAEYLAETIGSVLVQSMGDFHLFVIDNGSTDDTLSILNQIARDDSRLTVLHSPVNLSPPVVTNRMMETVGLEFPSYTWYLAHGADDVMESRYLDAIMDAAARHPTANCIFSPWQWIDHPEKVSARTLRPAAWSAARHAEREKSPEPREDSMPGKRRRAPRAAARASTPIAIAALRAPAPEHAVRRGRPRARP